MVNVTVVRSGKAINSQSAKLTASMSSSDARIKMKHCSKKASLLVADDAKFTY